MIYDDEGDIDYEAWYNRNKNYLPKEFIKHIEDKSDSLFFMFKVYRKVMKHLPSAVRELMLEQYPVFKTEKRPMVIEYINTIAETTGHTLLFLLYNLVQGQKKGVNIREKYPKFEEWVDFYGRPHKPDTIDENTRPQYKWLNDEEWIAYRDHENERMLGFFNWEEKRKFEFIDLVQTTIFKYYEEMYELNADEWIIYGVNIRDEYENFLCACEDVELFIDCGFPEEEIKLTDAEFSQNYSELSYEIKRNASALRNRRIAGEKI